MVQGDQIPVVSVSGTDLVDGLEARLGTLREAIMDVPTTEGAVERAQVCGFEAFIHLSLYCVPVVCVLSCSSVFVGYLLMAESRPIRCLSALVPTYNGPILTPIRPSLIFQPQQRRKGDVCVMEEWGRGSSQ